MVRKLIFCVTAILVLLLALFPPFNLPGNPDDKLLHVLAFLAMGLLASAAFRHARLFHLWLYLSGLAAIIELMQFIMHQGREADWYDFVAGFAAAAVALTCMSIIRWTVMKVKK